MFKCDNCDRHFEHPRIVVTTQGRLFGVPQIGDPEIEMKTCPYCFSDEVYEVEDESDSED